MINHRLEEKKFQKDIKYCFDKLSPQLFNKKFSIIELSSDYEDSSLSYDMKFNMNFNISVRIRKNNYIQYNDLTIRSKSKNGYKTEIDKIKEGKSQIYFYAYMSNDENSLEKIYICDVDSIRNLYKKNKYNQERFNNDGTAFIAFKFKDIEQDSIKNNYFFKKI